MNIDKSKVMVFRKCHRIQNLRFTYDNIDLEIVDSFVYLGLLLNYNGLWKQTLKRIGEQGSKSLYGLFNLFSEAYLPVKESTYVFDSKISPILLYGSEIWGLTKNQDNLEPGA